MTNAERSLTEAEIALLRQWHIAKPRPIQQTAAVYKLLHTAMGTRRRRSVSEGLCVLALTRHLATTDRPCEELSSPDLLDRTHKAPDRILQDPATGQIFVVEASQFALDDLHIRDMYHAIDVEGGLATRLNGKIEGSFFIFATRGFAADKRSFNRVLDNIAEGIIDADRNLRPLEHRALADDLVIMKDNDSGSALSLNTRKPRYGPRAAMPTPFNPTDTARQAMKEAMHKFSNPLVPSRSEGAQWCFVAEFAIGHDADSLSRQLYLLRPEFPEIDRFYLVDFGTIQVQAVWQSDCVPGPTMPR